MPPNGQQQARPVVVVVGTDASTRRMLASLLKSIDAQVENYDSAEAFLSRDGATLPQCVITEVRLPGMSGLELLKRLHASETQLPVVIVAAESDVPTAVAAMRYGATDFIEKLHVDVTLLRRISYLLKDNVPYGNI